MTSDTLTSRIEVNVCVEVTRPRAASWDMEHVASRVLYDLPPVETTTTGNGETYPVRVEVVGASSDSWGEREYRAHVRALADEVRERWQNYPSGFDASDAVHEAVDGSAWVIYYAGQRAVIRWTENIEAADDVGDLGRDVRAVLTSVAFFALRADVEDAIRREYGDPDDWATDDDSDDTGDDAEPDPHPRARPTPGGYVAVYDTNVNDHAAPVYVWTARGWVEGYDSEDAVVYADADDAARTARGYPAAP